VNEASPFRPGLVIGLIVAGLLSFAAFVALLAWGSSTPGRSSGRGTATSISAIGFSGLVRLTDRYFETELVRDESGVDTFELLVVALEPENEPDDLRHLLRRRAGMPTLVILPKWTVVPDLENRGWVRTFGPGEARAAEQLLGPDYDLTAFSAADGENMRRQMRSFDVLSGVDVPLPARPQLLEGDDVDMIAGVPGDGALVAQVGNEPHYIVADPDLLNNYGLRNADTARAALDLLRAIMPDEEGVIHFDVTFNGLGRGRSLLRSMFEPPFLAMTLALLIAALLAGYHGAVRFGPMRRPERAIPFGKAALVENSAGLVRLARREVRLGAGYADVVRDDAGRAGAAPPNLRDAELEAYLDRFTRPGETPFSELARQVRTSSDRAELMAAARALFRWKRDMIR
jgi:hypothetical protein